MHAVHEVSVIAPALFKG